MSNRETEDGWGEAREALDELERTVGSFVDGFADLSERLQASEERAEQLTEIVNRHVGEDAEPDSLLARHRQLQEENSDLRSRLDEGRAGVARTIARLRFLEERG